jgi:hypothetical protein
MAISAYFFFLITEFRTQLKLNITNIIRAAHKSWLVGTHSQLLFPDLSYKDHTKKYCGQGGIIVTTCECKDIMTVRPCKKQNKTKTNIEKWDATKKVLFTHWASV